MTIGRPITPTQTLDGAGLVEAISRPPRCVFSTYAIPFYTTLLQLHPLELGEHIDSGTTLAS